VTVVDNGKPAKAIATDYEKAYSLDKTPGPLLRQRSREPGLGGRAVRRSELQGVSDSRVLLFWKTYYNAVCSYVDKNILD
jgi:hypothetical protein